ncbi:uncharacterized protein LOC107762000 [Nicotiana tabacum]|uniref:Uncharacterized protein LOC107762000 n=1 Tax=Nicotiana tabacum TaxID=4097 RepID=A0AC58TXZ5_TOBAC
MATRDNDGRYFPENLAMEILIKLPIESLLRFKCVGKYRFENITSPSFIKEHMNWSRKNKPSKIMIYDHIGCPSNDDSPLNPNPITLISVSCAVVVHKNPDYLQEFRGMTYLLGSVDGLFLLERVIDGSIFNVFLALWNPAIRERFLMKDQKLLKAFIDDSICDSLQEMKDSLSIDFADIHSMLMELVWKKATTSILP